MAKKLSVIKFRDIWLHVSHFITAPDLMNTSFRTDIHIYKMVVY